MAVALTLGEIAEILSSGEFGRFIGHPESEVLDAKSSPYTLGEATRNFELAKDISALANSRGGFIILGLAADEPDAATMTELITSVRPIPLDKVNPKQYRDVIQSHVYPKPTVAMRWVQGNDSQRLFVIEVTAHESEQPYLTVSASLGGGAVTGRAYGFFERSGAHTDVATVEAMQGHLRDGRRFNQIVKARLEAIELQIADLSRRNERAVELEASFNYDELIQRAIAQP